MREKFAHNYIDITGQKFGKLTAIEPIRTGMQLKWRCVCDCGAEKVVTSQSLRKGRTKSCGCYTSMYHRTNCTDLSGMKFGRLTVIERDFSRNNGVYWFCLCECGNKKSVLADQLTSSKVRSCGCYRKEATVNRLTTHGESKTRLYHIWGGIKSRCKNGNVKGYSRYGGRGISICDEWDKSFDLFMEWALLNGYSDELTLDRIDVNGNYCPENCRWATPREQSRNKRNNIYITCKGETMLLQDWAERTGIKEGTLRTRLKIGWTDEETVTIPSKVGNRISSIRKATKAQESSNLS